MAYCASLTIIYFIRAEVRLYACYAVLKSLLISASCALMPAVTIRLTFWKNVKHLVVPVFFITSHKKNLRGKLSNLPLVSPLLKFAHIENM